MGGFARRMSYFNAFAERYPTRPFLRLDGGSIFSRGRAESSIVNRWMLEGTFLSKLDAVNLSAWDAPVWQEMADLASSGQIQKEFLRIPLVSANVRPRSRNHPEVSRYVIKECRVHSASDKVFRIGITGLLDDPEDRIPRRYFQVDDPERALKQVFAELKGIVDYRIVLTDMDVGSAVSLAIGVPGIDLILVSHNYDSLTEPEQVGSTLMVIPVNEGRMINEVRISLDPKSGNIDLQSRFVPLDQTVPDDPAMSALARKARAAVDDFMTK
jgi:hypothetical protein